MSYAACVGLLPMRHKPVTKVRDSQDAACLFCGAAGPFNTIEHIVPASLGNTCDVLTGVVCDACQAYFGSKVEKAALEKTPIGFWRCLLGIRGRTGRLPSVFLDPPSGGVLPSDAAITTPGVVFSAHEDGSTSLDVYNDATMHGILDGRISQVRLCLSPLHLSVMGRFLGKMGLEYLARDNRAAAYASQHDLMRRFVRYGSARELWPVYWGHTAAGYCHRRIILVEPLVELHEVDCYSFCLGKTRRGHFVFAFSMGTDIWLVDLSSPVPSPCLQHAVEGTALACIAYSDWAFGSPSSSP